VLGGRAGTAGAYEDQHAAGRAQHQVQRALLLNVIVGQRAAVLQLLAGEDEALLVQRDACTNSPTRTVSQALRQHSHAGAPRTRMVYTCSMHG
jgi:hypothetical protein